MKRTKRTTTNSKKQKVDENNVNGHENGTTDDTTVETPKITEPTFINLKNGQSMFKSFLGDDITIEDFLENYWEKKPLIIKRSENQDWLNYLKNTFDFNKMKTIIKDNKLLYGIDINLCKLVDEKKKVFNKKGNAKLDYVCNSFDKEKVTVQFHQPQRFSVSPLHYLDNDIALTIGSNVYITPAGSQGLAPHHDDIEAFVIQLEGSKHWLLYSPISELPNTFSNDMNANDLKEPLHDIVLNAGDILYFPRGTIHQANTPENENNQHSTHITISTYQDFNRMEYISSVISEALEKSFKNNLELRRGVPVGFFRNGNFSEMIKSTLEKINLDNNACFPSEMLKDFMRNRLPPFGITDIPDSNVELNSKHLELLKNPDENLKVKLKYPEHINAVLANEEEDEDELDDEEEVNEMAKKDDGKLYTFIYHSVFNIRDFHMMQEQENDNCLKLNEQCFEIFKVLTDGKNNDEWVDLAKIEESLNKTVDRSVLSELLVSLATENLLEIFS